MIVENVLKLHSMLSIDRRNLERNKLLTDK